MNPKPLPPDIALEQIESDNIHSAGYDRAHSILAVRFHSGGLYHYFDAPESHLAGLRQAESPTAYLNEHIKGHYRYELVANFPRTPSTRKERPASAPADAARPAEAGDEFDAGAAEEAIRFGLSMIAEQRRLAEAAGAEYDRLYQAFLASPAMVELKEKRDAAQTLVTAADQRVREAAVNYYRHTGRQTVAVAVKVRLMSKVSYNATTALNHCRTHLPQLINLDKTKFDKHARAVAATAPLSFVAIEQVPEATIAQDLTAFLSAPAAPESA